ncbi:hypothetical protein PACTADRAFT_50213 [Pachysolen tannophilus NRRL Y-2460]|uniref:NAD(P)H-hydrate epimerase n=1 Tax=Pachysolen tannophilus NRRL Y-2460 TaxID=669874 RepID=A0A1E4TUU4_PACTA|nr:hypothetical protein PACTADRAFT_50213 [Pachysolen tannophilus NRRL Y-2460]
MSFKVLSSTVAAAVDKELMSTVGFSIDQLMELAGLSVAQAVYKTYPPSTHNKVLVICGPGNNGGDGLVASRHLKLFGYTPTVYYPKHKSSNVLFNNLLTQLKTFKIDVLQNELSNSELKSLINENDQIIDAIFGFSFHPPLRSPFDTIIEHLKQVETSKPITCVDCPTGWDVDKGPNIADLVDAKYILNPSSLVSLTAPKPGSKFFKGNYHYLGGRFISKEMAQKWDIDIPNYPGVDQVVRLNI